MKTDIMSRAASREVNLPPNCRAHPISGDQSASERPRSDGEHETTEVPVCEESGGSPPSRTQARVILLGTDWRNPRGGIGAVMPGYQAALETQGLLDCFIPTYQPGSLRGKWWPAVKALAPMIRHIRRLRANSLQPVVYAHAGEWPSLLREGFLLLVARAVGGATWLQIHAVSVDRYLSHPIGRTLFRQLRHAAGVLCTLTPWWAARLRSAGIQDRIEVVPNPLLPELEAVARRGRRHRIQSSEMNEGETITILTMTRLVSGKGVDIVLKALDYLPRRFHCIVAGEGPERVRLKQWVRNAGLQHQVVFTGWVSGQEKERLWAEADIFCLPSIYDSFLMGSIEAMAHCVPVVALRTGPIAEIVDHGRTGILTEDSDPRAVAAALRALADPTMRDQMGEAGRKRVLEKFSIAVVGERLKCMADSLT